MQKSDGAGFLEKFGTAFDGVRMWFSKAWQIGVLMAKGAYLLGERRRLFVKLGEETYERILRGDMHDPSLEPLVHQLDRLTKKVEIEEMLIRKLRYGRHSARNRPTPPEASSAPGN